MKINILAYFPLALLLLHSSALFCMHDSALNLLDSPEFWAAHNRPIYQELAKGAAAKKEAESKAQELKNLEKMEQQTKEKNAEPQAPAATTQTKN